MDTSKQSCKHQCEVVPPAPLVPSSDEKVVNRTLQVRSPEDQKFVENTHAVSHTIEKVFPDHAEDGHGDVEDHQTILENIDMAELDGDSSTHSRDDAAKNNTAYMNLFIFFY